MLKLIFIAIANPIKSTNKDNNPNNSLFLTELRLFNESLTSEMHVKKINLSEKTNIKNITNNIINSNENIQKNNVKNKN